MRHVALACLFALSAGTAEAYDVTACGQEVPPGQVGNLVADLDCSGFGAEPAVRLGARTILRLNGFALTGSPSGAAVQVAEGATVAIDGPGEIRDAGIGVFALRARVITRSGLVVTGCGSGIDLPAGNVIATNVTVADNAGDGVRARAVDAVDVVADGNGSRGLAATTKMRLTRVSASGNGGAGIVGARVKASDLTLNDNGMQGAFVVGGRLKADLVEATGNGGAGILGGSLKLGGSTVSDNCLGGFDHADLVTDKRPKLENVDCGTSAVRNSQFGEDWDVCDDD